MNKAVRKVILQEMMVIAKRENITYGNVEVTFNLKYREGKPQLFSCKDPVEHTYDEDIIRGML